MRIEEIWRYPVKSLQGERVESADVTNHGIEGDRGWGILDAGTGRVLTARREPALLFAVAEVVDGEVMVILPDGAQTTSDEELSAWLGRPVQLVSADSGVAGTFETQVDETETGDWFTWEGPDGSFHDSGRTQASLASRATFRDWDPRRFRINVIVSGGGEEALVGTSLAVSDSSLRFDVSKEIERCVVTTRPQPDGIERDLDVLKTVNRERDGNLGIGLVVTSPGVITVGSEVSPA